MRKKTGKTALPKSRDTLSGCKDETRYERIRKIAYEEAARRKRHMTWFPQFRQFVMMNRREDEAFYGGAAGGGKTDYLVVEAMSQVNIPNYRGLILRKTYPELSEIVDKSYLYYKTAFPRARYNSTAHCWTFPSGAKIYFGSMQYEKDKHKYQGRQFDFIGFDELTHFTLGEYEYMKSRNRAAGPNTKVYMRATGNPGGIGHGWVKQYFVRAGEPEETITTDIEVADPDGKVYKMQTSKIFIPSKVFDNQALLKNNPQYLARLASLNEQDRKALLDGDWDIFSGQVFTEFRDNPDGYVSQKMSHVIKPFRIPEHWQIYRGFDFGYSKPFSVGWYAADTDGVIYRIREYYGCQVNTQTGQTVPDTGVKLEPAEIARNIREIEQNDINLRGREITGIADPAIFEESRGESIATVMAREGVYFGKADNTRLAGKMQMHYRLHFDKNGRAKFYVFNTCREFIRTVPALVYDEKHVEDVDTKGEDHIYDECRYVLMENPLSPPQPEQAEEHEFDPLNQFTEGY